MYKHTGIYLLSRVTPAAVSLIAVPIYVRLLGQEQYGAYALLNVVVLTGSNVLSAWLVQAILRYRSADAGRSVQLATGAGLLVSIALTSILVAGYGIVKHLSAPETFVAVCAAWALLSYTVSYASKQADLNPLDILYAEAARAIGLLVIPLSVYALTGYRGLALPILGLAAGNMLGVWVLNRRGMTFRFGWERSMLANFVRFGAPLTAWMFTSVLINSLDKFMVEHWLGLEAVGAYAALSDVVYRSCIVLLVPIGQATHPVMMKEWEHGEHAKALSLVRKTAGLTVLVGCVLVLGWVAANGLVQKVLLGKITEGGALVIGGAAVAACLWQLSVVVQKPIEMASKTARLAIFALMGFAVQVGLNAWFLADVGLWIASLGMASASATYWLLVTSSSARLIRQVAT